MQHQLFLKVCLLFADLLFICMYASYVLFHYCEETPWLKQLMEENICLQF